MIILRREGELSVMCMPYCDAGTTNATPVEAYGGFLKV